MIITSGGSRISRRGGAGPRRGGAVDPRGGYVLKMLHVKTKESGPVGGAPGAPPLDPPMITQHYTTLKEVQNNYLYCDCNKLSLVVSMTA